MGVNGGARLKLLGGPELSLGDVGSSIVADPDTGGEADEGSGLLVGRADEDADGRASSTRGLLLAWVFSAVSALSRLCEEFTGVPDNTRGCKLRAYILDSLNWFSYPCLPVNQFPRHPQTPFHR
jgi:hypothetical protein